MKILRALYTHSSCTHSCLFVSFGRRPIYLVNTVGTAIISISTAFVPNVYVYFAFRVMDSMCGIAAFTSTFVLCKYIRKYLFFLLECVTSTFCNVKESAR